jgi:hypothetical protein
LVTRNFADEIEARFRALVDAVARSGLSAAKPNTQVEFCRGLTQFPDSAESETGEAPVHVFNPVTRKIFT